MDELTGALRRRVGLLAIQREMDRTLRSRELFTLAFVDVDGLKRINDECGHLAGDAVLREVAHTVAEHLRSYDLIIRFGGDEFLVALSGQDAGGARERFREISALLLATNHHPTISVGFSERVSAETLDEIIAQADSAVLRTRRSGRRR